MGSTTGRYTGILRAQAYVGLEERDALVDVPNAFPYIRCIETEKAGYLIRQHLYGSLYDRIRLIHYSFKADYLLIRAVHDHFLNLLRNAGLLSSSSAASETVMPKAYPPHPPGPNKC
jgi:hypothetical protein